jgi:tRNA (cmo5U34)-methyltransferase
VIESRLRAYWRRQEPPRTLRGERMTADAPAAFADAAAWYDERRRRLVPPFEAFYGAAVEGLLLGRQPMRRVLDLGAGTGMLSSKVADAHPQAHLVLVDGAQPMLDRAATLLGDRATTCLADLRDPFPDGPFDAVVSALAIHHLTDDDKRELFGRVKDCLEPGGVFINAEQVLAPTRLHAESDAMWHHDAASALGTTEREWADAEELMRHDRCATLEDQLRWLRDAGFADVDCLYKMRRFAVISAISAAAADPTSRKN